jgi:hypothetical protein
MPPLSVDDRRWLDEELNVVEQRFDDVHELLITANGRLDAVILRLEELAQRLSAEGGR